ncbi:hypothetical protein B0H17DRAFT_1087242 [Mycena rosella]|uniref:Uncharacterized protein n=1 Tax=Mycena rosella TaxID=1033263 RepID=A0AAD7CXZ1_MYCRO|nr:hypothetical protein B0H17DRAFT_1087242 [Mycena rosella]
MMTQFVAGVPFITTEGLESSVTERGQHEWGRAESKTETIKSSVLVTLPARSKAHIIVRVKRKTIEVPFTYKDTRTDPELEAASVSEHRGCLP